MTLHSSLFLYKILVFSFSSAPPCSQLEQSMTIIPNLTADFRRKSMVNYAFPELHPTVSYMICSFSNICPLKTLRPSCSLPPRTCWSTPVVAWTLVAGGTVSPSPSCRLPQQDQTPPSSPFRGRRARKGTEGEWRQWAEYKRQREEYPPTPKMTLRRLR